MFMMQNEINIKIGKSYQLNIEVGATDKNISTVVKKNQYVNKLKSS